MESTNPIRHCTATSRAGKQCGNPPIPGGNVCRFHGGGAPQVKRAAALRLMALVDPAITVLAANLKERKKNPAIAQRAAEDILDRAGLKAPEKHSHTVQGEVDLRVDAREQLLSRISSLSAPADEKTGDREPDGKTS